MFTVGLSHNLPLEGFEKEFEGFKVIRPEKLCDGFTMDEVVSFLPECDAFITMLDFPFKKELFDIAGKLKVIGNLGSGFDNVDIKTATERGVIVLNTPQSVVAPTSEMTMTLILSIARSVCWYDRTFRGDLTCHKNLLLERDMCLEGKKLGILGFGRIGKGVAKKAIAFGMKIIYYDLYRASAEVEEEYGATYYPYGIHSSSSPLHQLRAPCPDEADCIPHQRIPWSYRLREGSLRVPEEQGHPWSRTGCA